MREIKFRAREVEFDTKRKNRKLSGCMKLAIKAWNELPRAGEGNER